MLRQNGEVNMRRREKNECTSTLIRKKWNKYLQDEMMLWFGIHILSNPRAEYSNELYGGRMG